MDLAEIIHHWCSQKYSMDIYLSSFEAISPQRTFNTGSFLKELKVPEKNYFTCIEPRYEDHIDPRFLRRLGRIVRMSLVASIKCLKNNNIEKPDAILTGTSLGCVQDTAKFLLNLHKGTINPTSFIHSTHNTVSGQIALFLKCKNYNLTYSHNNISFETALIDASMLLKEHGYNDILLGGVDEITEESFQLLSKTGCIKNSKIDLQNTINNGSRGYYPGEGVNFFIISNRRSDNTIARIDDVMFISMENDHSNIAEKLYVFLKNNNVKTSDIDILISGNNGDVLSDNIYDYLLENVFTDSLNTVYKNVCGEYDTAQSFGLWTALKIIKEQHVPQILRNNDRNIGNIRRILLYNHKKYFNHSFILLSV